MRDPTSLRRAATVSATVNAGLYAYSTYLIWELRARKPFSEARLQVIKAAAIRALKSSIPSGLSIDDEVQFMRAALKKLEQLIDDSIASRE